MAQQQQRGAFQAPGELVPEGQAADLSLVGHACYRRVLQNAFDARTLLDGLFARNAGQYLPVTSHRSYLSYLAVLCAGDVHNFRHIQSSDHLHAVDALVVANALAGFLEHLLPQEAELRAKKALLLFLKHWVGTGKTTFVRLTDTEYDELRGPNGTWRNLAFLPATRAELRNLDVGSVVATAAYNLEAYQVIMAQLMTLEAPRTIQTPPRVFATFFISMAKRGTITVDKLNRVTEELNDTLGITLDLDTASIRLTYKTIGSRVPDEKIKELFPHLSRMVSDISLRMKITLDQAVGTGLTALTTIKRARSKFPTFPWGRAARLLATDFQNAAAAAREVGDDSYYGFRRELGVVKGTLYRSLSWLCKELLVRYGGPEHAPLARYQGWNNNPEHKAVLQQMVEEFQPGAIAPNEVNQAAVDSLVAALESASGLAAS
ncbi:putative nucleoprotein [Changping Tick Virus 3]|uniref:Putative nucleoprotein n=1 Tax=Changping Tick Virus 3 TaxID=1608045 RepID=A0A0B5KX77_9VIRU|nr:putative nucleoprotein [Changping Tick Virus 3]AJG39048.1 putative nucleoprotein [Changping Tick Virus 3]WFD55773.1 MAG: N protein [Changping Tick Virus 3]WFD55775.1 MAG: N protein [Changping Tick Virus 3]WFD55777.1 MAG: N protein [Changping Tick Virus 3]WFD55779.1 MAG: N protein [Changping Tick Virus 3]